MTPRAPFIFRRASQVCTSYWTAHIAGRLESADFVQKWETSTVAGCRQETQRTRHIRRRRRPLSATQERLCRVSGRSESTTKKEALQRCSTHTHRQTSSAHL